ncbi:hypothetical protein AUEXF2481DRAFT_5996 [Aureobasidium subglaciale EXF-2481]|uniref:Uncharacterized protein n=1 Tax=Aureobasidium subglaciale (strain EXF-2481) TaxID=1043005 RepID=A0A074YEM9_AURSE|nr:uncharacterized protein AUEXF2481DRAFT_5996 [Aureobasidium subglaciale EXF-2481]KEQ94514.1 hypothetical protein AUEXF2481DRAFT_5996 [Aureobasidium subglaciale EXF-2481]
MSLQRLGFAACALFLGARAIDTISVPDVITADSPFTLTITPKDDDDASGNYRIYLDTTPPGYAGGQSCYLKNTTSIDITAVNLTIPADFGPNGDFYSISTRDLSDSDTDASYVFSNAFNLTGATGKYSEYENKLNGAPLWDANSLPCESYNCARNCAQNSYPKDMIPGSDAFNAMRACIMECPGVSKETKTASSTSSTATSTKTGSHSSTSASATGTSTSDEASSASDSAAAASSSTGAASANMVPVSLVAAGGLLAFFL